MGQIQSRKSKHQNAENFAISSSTPEAVVHFEPSESYLVSYGVDRHTSRAFAKPLNPGAALSAERVRLALVDTEVLPARNTALYKASDYDECCGITDMKDTFQEQAKKVGRNGVFFFHFSGHGTTNGCNKWSLAPADFDRTQHTYITAETLARWLSEIECKAKYIVFTLDCCFSGGVAEQLKASHWTQSSSRLYVISACTALEVTTTLGTLEHSIFSHFLSVAFKASTGIRGELPIEETFRKCQVCSTALSSLLVRYSFTEGLQCKVSQPQLHVIDLRSQVKEMMGEGEDQADSRAEAKLQFVLDLYDKTRAKSKLHKKTIAWLESLAAQNGPLTILKDHQVLSGDVLTTAYCSIMFSTASLELAYHFKETRNPNHSLTAFLHVAAVMERVVGGAEITRTQFHLGWQFYRKVLKEKRLEQGLAELHTQLASDPTFNEELTAMGV